MWRFLQPTHDVTDDVTLTWGGEDGCCCCQHCCRCCSPRCYSCHHCCCRYLAFALITCRRPHALCRVRASICAPCQVAVDAISLDGESAWHGIEIRLNHRDVLSAVWAWAGVHRSHVGALAQVGSCWQSFAPPQAPVVASSCFWLSQSDAP